MELNGAELDGAQSLCSADVVAFDGSAFDGTAYDGTACDGEVFNHAPRRSVQRHIVMGRQKHINISYLSTRLSNAGS